MKLMLAAVGVLLVGQALADETAREAGLGTCRTTGNHKFCTKESVTDANNCKPQPDCRAEYTTMETVTVTSTLFVNGHVMNSVHVHRRPIRAQ